MPRSERPRWEDYKQMIAWKARKYSRLFGVEHDELVCEGNLVFTLAVQRYNKRRGAFSTFLWRCLDNGMLTFCRRERRQMFFDYAEDIEAADREGRAHPMSTAYARGAAYDGRTHIKGAIHVQQCISQLPVPAATALRMLLKCPADLGLTGDESPKAVRGALLAHIYSHGERWSGPSWQAVRSLFSEKGA